jgi:hypothetical protein
MALQTNSQQFLPVSAASVATPASGTVVKFLDAATGHLSQKDSAGVVSDLLGAGYPGQLDLSSYTGSDVTLALGQTAFYNFTSIASLALRIATLDGEEYKISLEMDYQAGAAGTGPVFLQPNNTTVANAFSQQSIFGSNTTPSAGLNDSISNAHSIGTNAINYGVTCFCSTRTKSKTTRAHFISKTATNWLSGSIYSVWQDTTTPHSSLGTVVFPLTCSGRVSVTKIEGASAGGGVNTILPSSSPPQIDLSNYSGADVALALGQNAIYTFSTGITSLPLKIATGDNQSYKIEGFFTLDPAANDAPLTLSPNNTTLGTSIKTVTLYGVGTPAAAAAGQALTQSVFNLSINAGRVYYFSAVVSTKTNGKSVTSFARQANTTAEVEGTASSTSSDTTTVWSSLGTITFPTGYAGRVVVTKLSDASAGGGVPGLIAAGSGTEVQYRNGGTFAAANNVSIQQNTLALLPLSAEPTAPTLEVLLYAMDIAGNKVPKWVGPSGIDTPVQASLIFNTVSVLSAGNGTAISALNAAVTTVGTVSHPAIASTNLKTQTRRYVVTSAATAGAFADQRVPYNECWRSNNSNYGGFWPVIRFGLATLVAGNRGFFGLLSSTSALTNIDLMTETTLAKLGLGFNTNTGNLFLIVGNAGVAPTTTDLGANFALSTSSMYEAAFFCKPNDTVIAYRLRNLSLFNPATDIKGTLTTNLPANTTFLARRMFMTNNATASAVAFDVARYGLELDY